ncbi:AraC family transcriptional regulator [Piscinibacter terrae]|uniref:AraC family transcriptional regulator n=1 Tax=Piscinibacter terrae TaxID=2496871 RepID=A0A3N7J511_9BURK|nr:AraC family transcriptional regulator [Albitalea terrae]RQP25912.1 AraC family transcriptional regulator [Albitalea terrae]
MLIVRDIDTFRSQGHGASVTLLACQCRPSSPGPVDRRLCIKAMQRGLEHHHFRQRRLTLDEDAYLILKGGDPASSIYEGESWVQPFAAFFGDELVKQALRGALEDGAERDLGLLEHLRPHGDALSLQLRRLVQRVNAGDEDDSWIEEQALALLDGVLDLEREVRHAGLGIGSVKPATRLELLRRVLLATDFILSNHEQPITLGDIAGAARLSRFHLVRLFRQVLGSTPHAYLLSKRLAVAERLLLHTQLDLNDIAQRSGFGTRSSLFRHLRKQRGAGGVALRNRLDTPMHATRTADHTPCHTSA